MILKRSIAAAWVALAAFTMAACGSGSDPLTSGSTSPSGSASGSASAGPSASGSASGSASASASSSPVVVGSAAFTESTVIAELYAQAMKAKGVDASTKLNIGSREVYIKALQDKSVSVVPEYTGNLLAYFDKTTKATTAAAIEAALPKAVGSQLKVLKSSKAADQDVYVVTKDYAAKNGIASLADLTKVASSATLGGPPELVDRPYGPKGLKSAYGVTLKAFKPYGALAV